MAEAGVEDAERIGSDLLDRFGSLSRLCDATDGELREALAGHPSFLTSLLASRRILAAALRERAVPAKLDPADPALQSYLRHRIGFREGEVLLGLFADDQNTLIAERKLAASSGASLLFSPHQILRATVMCGARQVLLVHNHPSGRCEPSKSDIVSTEDFQQRAALLSIRLIDHLIVAGRDIFSMRRGHRL